MNLLVLEKANEICAASGGKILKVCDVGTKQVYVQLKENSPLCINEAFQLIQKICPGVKEDELEFEYENQMFNFDWCMFKRQGANRRQEVIKARNQDLIDQGIKNVHLADF